MTTKSGFAIIDWNKTVDVCSDITCQCGEGMHHCTHENTSAQHARCPYCKKVTRLHDRVELFADEKDANNHVADPSTFVQWKGTSIFMRVHCPCQHQFDVEDIMFAYHVDCPACHQTLHSAWHITGTVLSEEESKAVAVIHEPED
ncbi:MAG TPA: hypothetical protein V6C81_12240 [Planktothrix sp.]